MATQTSPLIRISGMGGSVRLECDWDDVGVKLDAEGEPIIEDQPLIGLRTVNDIPLKGGKERLVEVVFISRVGQGQGRSLRHRPSRGSEDLVKPIGVNNVGDIEYSLGISDEVTVI